MITSTNYFNELRALKATMLLLQFYFEKQFEGAMPNWDELEIKKNEFNACLEKLNELIPVIVAEKPDPALIGQDIKESLDLVAANLKAITEIAKLRKP